MAAYGSLVSVMQIIDQLRQHPRPPISIRKEHVESLTANLTFLQEFLEGYNPNVSYTAEADPLESRIAEAAYAAEDVIESYIVDQIHSRSSSDHVEEISSAQFYKGLQKVIEEMDLINLEIKKKLKDKKNMGVQIIKKQSTDYAAPSRSSSNAQKVGMVGFDDVLNHMLDKLTGGERVRQIIPIVGMGGLGKTTLARNIYAHPLINERFHICAWSTISQDHNARKILSEILDQVGLGSGGDLSEGDLGVKLYQHLIGRRYLIVMDDIWSIEAWDVVRRYFPDSENGSRVVVTTRLSDLASKFDYSEGLDMNFLDEDSSWSLFSKTIFGDGIFPPELVDTGKRILKGCRGLPLSIVVVGGLLLKSEATRENWELIEKNLSTMVNSEDDGSSLQILYTSYNNLPVYVKPCFLYLGIWDEDQEIAVSDLIPVLVAEGLIKPIDGKSLEEAAEEYTKELVARNLLLVETRSHDGELKEVKMHDLVRDVCLREAQKDKFLCVLGEHTIPASMSSQRRILCPSMEEYPPKVLIESLEPTTSSHVRSLIGEFPETLSTYSFRLLRVWPGFDSVEVRDEDIFIRVTNLRYISVDDEEHPLPRIHTWASSIWNLQTLYITRASKDFLVDIWKMPLLRLAFIEASGKLPDPPLSGDDMDEVVLQNLHTLGKVRNLILSENVVKRIPNIRKLKLAYDDELDNEDLCLNNLPRLHKLQSLQIDASSVTVHQLTLTLPHSLKKLTLQGTCLPWEEMTSKIGCLPLLQVLKLRMKAVIGSEWETVEGQFSSLKFLEIKWCDELVHWTTESTHFPRLEHLVLIDMSTLSEVPSSIGDITTLKSIRLKDCSDSAVESVRRIQEEQEENGNELQIHVYNRSERFLAN